MADMKIVYDDLIIINLYLDLEKHEEVLESISKARAIFKRHNRAKIKFSREPAYPQQLHDI